MNTKITLVIWKKISKCIADEIESNEEFAGRIAEALDEKAAGPKPVKQNRRGPAKIDPYDLYKQGVDSLHAALDNLTDEELKDVISAHKMYDSKSVMRWKNRDKLINYIIEVIQHRLSHGSAFWNIGVKKINRD